MSETNEFEIYEIWLKSIHIGPILIGDNPTTRKAGCENCSKYSREHPDRIEDLLNNVSYYYLIRNS